MALTKSKWKNLMEATMEIIPTSASKPKDVLEIPALGRPFQLGMLYDARNDKLLPGITLWNQAELHKNLESQVSGNTEFQFIASDSLDRKMSALNMDSELKLSFLSGLVEANGSAKYLSDRKTFAQQRRVTWHYTCTTRFDQLSMSHLGQDVAKHTDVFDRSLAATHFVTAITYGADAFLVFESKESLSSNVKDVQEKLEAAVKNIPNLSKSVSASHHATENADQIQNEIACKYFGDLAPERNPTTYEEAIAVYKELPTLLGPNGEKAVPKKVWLQPLSLLDSRGGRTLRRISNSLVEEAVNIMEHINEVKLKAIELKSSPTCQNLFWVHKDVEHFREMLTKCESKISNEMKILLPAVRGGLTEELKLKGLLEGYRVSPFNAENIANWIEKRTGELKFIEGYLKTLTHDGILVYYGQEELDALLYHIETDKVVAFEMCLLDANQDPLLDQMAHFVGESKGHTKAITSEAEDCCTKNPVSREKIKTDLSAFLAFAKRNKDWPGTKFVASVISCKDPNQNGAINIVLHSNSGKSNFYPPSKPNKPTRCTASWGYMEIKWEPPIFGAEHILRYGCQRASAGLTSYLYDNSRVDRTNGPETTLTWANSTVTTSYDEITVHGITAVGRTEDSDKAAWV